MTRITRTDNIIISLINSDILFSKTTLSHNLLFTKYIENISRIYIFNNIYNSTYNISSLYRNKPLFKKYILGCIILDFILSPFMLFYITLSYILKHSKDIKNNTQLFNKKWTNYALWKYREYNELENDFNDRMFKSYFHMNKYISFYPNKTFNIIIYFIRFVLSLFILFLFTLSIIDDDALVKLKYKNYNLIWYFALLTIIMSILNRILKTRDFEDSIDKVIENLTKYIHVLPPKDAVYNFQMYKSITRYYKSHIINILYEILSIIISPYILYKCYYQNADTIIDYIYENTMYIDNIGVVDKYSNFMLNYNIDGKLEHTIHDIKKDERTDKYNINNLILYKKREKSFISFIELYPDWKMYSTDLEEYIHKIKKYQDETSSNTNNNENLMFSSELMFSSIQN